jgi:hypothetical protein
MQTARLTPSFGHPSLCEKQRGIQTANSPVYLLGGAVNLKPETLNSKLLLNQLKHAAFAGCIIKHLYVIGTGGYVVV